MNFLIVELSLFPILIPLGPKYSPQSELIIGCKSFVQWRTQVNFDRNMLIMLWNNRIKEVPFLDANGTTGHKNQMENILEKTFFVEMLVARIHVHRNPQALKMMHMASKSFC